MTIIAKATFAFAPDAPMPRVEPQEILRAEVHHGRDPGRSVRFSSDLAPYLGRADVLFTGHAHAPPGSSARAEPVRLAVFAGQKALLDKRLIALDLDGFQRMPVVYELARRGVDERENPLGLAATERGPHLLDPASPHRPAGFGPIGRAWPVRKRLLGALPQEALERPIAEIPEPFDWSYFQAAPPDQRTDLLRGDEWILLEGLHPALPLLRTQLPGVHGVSRVHGLSAFGIADGQPLDLSLDTLRIDGDKQCCTVVCRRSFPVADEAALTAMRVVAGIQIAGEAIAWPDPRAVVSAASRSSSSSAPEQATAAGTLMLSPEGKEPAPGHRDMQRGRLASTLELAPEQREAAALPALPFQPAPPRAPGSSVPPRAPGSSVPPRAPGSSVPPRAPGSSVPPRAEPRERPFTGTLTVSPELDALLAVERALPFHAQASLDPAAAIPAPITAGQRLVDMAPAPLPLMPSGVEPLKPPEPAPPAAAPLPLMPSGVEPLKPPEPAPPAAAPLPLMPSGVEPLKPPEPAPPAPDTPAAAPEPEPAPPDLPIERFAAISAEIAEGRAPRPEVLRAHELTEPAWAAAERSWGAAIAEDGANGSGALRRAWDSAYLTAVEGFRGPVTAAEYARILAGQQRGRANQVLDDLRIQRPALMPIIRVWTQKVAADAKLVGEVGAALAAARRS